MRELSVALGLSMRRVRELLAIERATRVGTDRPARWR